MRCRRVGPSGAIAGAPVDRRLVSPDPRITESRNPQITKSVVRRTAVHTRSMRVWPGSPYPLGATWDGVGVNFALFSEHATRVELCLFDTPDATKETHRIDLREQNDQVCD